MARVIATAADAGRSCPYCRFPLKEGAAAERCNSCSSLHHEDCWHDGGGCAMLGCPEVGRGAAAGAGAGAAWPGSAQPQAGYAGAQPPPGYYAAPPGYPPPPLVPPRTGNNNVLIIATLIALIGIGTGTVLATGALSSGSTKHPRPPAALQPAPLPKSQAPSGATPSERVRGRRAIMGILGTYQRAYSDRDTSGLASIFTPAIKRHGLAAGGCTVSTGRGAVLADYQSQFEEGSGSYELVGLSQWQVSFDSKTKAHIDTHYRIADSSIGFVNFRFTNSGEGWRMSEVYATCA
jgi:hypothetical protein